MPYGSGSKSPYRLAVGTWEVDSVNNRLQPEKPSAIVPEATAIALERRKWRRDILFIVTPLLLEI